MSDGTIRVPADARAETTPRRRWRVATIIGAALLVVMAIPLSAPRAAAQGAPPAVTNVPVTLPIPEVTLQGVSCVGSRCVAVGYQCGAGGCGGFMRGAIMVSTDAGQSWRAARFPATAGFLHDVTCSGPTCLAIGMSRPGVHGSYLVVRSVNGGASWRLSTLRPPVLISVSCASPRVCFATVDSRLTAKGIAIDPEVLVSHDAGSTWQRTAIPALQEFNGANVTCGSATSCVVTVFATESGALTHLWLTTNSGKTWSTGAIPWRGPDDPLALQCASRLVCIASGAGGGGTNFVATTRSSSAQWSAATVSTWLPSVAGCATTTTCFAAGNVLVPWGGAVVDEVTVSPLRQVTVPLHAASGVPTPVAISCTATYCVLVGALYTVSNGQATSLAPYVARWSL